MQENVLQERTPYILPFAKIKMSLAHYAGAVWQGMRLRLAMAIFMHGMFGIRVAWRDVRENREKK